jgi:ATP-dependent exoDNAse (exonuclease V) alpha subunit
MQLEREATGRAPQPILTKKSLLVVDECSMVGSRDMASLIDAIERAGARLLLVGDPKQLQSISAGAPFGKICEMVRAPELTVIQRQEEPWLIDAIKNFREGNALEALNAFDEKGFFHAERTRTKARTALITAWKEEGIRRPEENVILAAERREVRRLNELAQEERIAAGAVKGASVSVNGYEFSSGDRILFRENRKSYGVCNGDLGTIIRANAGTETLTIRLDNDKRLVTIRGADFEKLELGYAMGVFPAQGITVKNSFVLAHSSTLQGSELTYVSASRAREKTVFYTDQATKDLVKEMSRSNRKELAHEIGDDSTYERQPQLEQRLEIEIGF